MIVTEILGNIHEPEGAALVRQHHIETVFVDLADVVKRIQRLTTDHGTEVGLRLASTSADLKDGDILWADDANAIVMKTKQTDVIVIRPRSVMEMGFVAHSLGNRHLPAQFAEPNEMIVQYDHTVADFLNAHEVPFVREERVLDVAFRHAEHTH